MPGHKVHCHILVEPKLHFTSLSASWVFTANPGQQWTSLAPAGAALLKAAWTARACTQMSTLKEQIATAYSNSFVFLLGLPKYKSFPAPQHPTLRPDPKAKLLFKKKKQSRHPLTLIHALSSSSSPPTTLSSTETLHPADQQPHFELGKSLL